LEEIRIAPSTPQGSIDQPPEDGKIYTYYIANEVSGAARRGVEFCGDGNELKVENLKFE
jgi:hypothetical protein